MRQCKWYPNNRNHTMPSHQDWPWSLCPICDNVVHQYALQLVQTDAPITYPAFGDLVPEDVKNEGGFWQYDILRTLLNHYSWVRHIRRDHRTWGCNFHGSAAHFHPPLS